MPVRASEVPVAATETQKFATRHTRRLSRNLALQVNRAIKTCDAGAVHQTRVAIRRLSQALAVCKTCFHAKEMRKTRRRLKKMMSAAGVVRNCDIAERFLIRWRPAGQDELRSKLVRRRQEAARALVAQIAHWKERKGSSPFVTRPDSSAGSLPDLEQRALERISKDFFQRGNDAASSKASAHDLHRFRIAAKKFRYTLELFQPLSPLLENLKRLSTLLGDINDCVTAAQLVPPLAARLAKRQRKKTEAFRQYWAAEFADAKLRRKPVATALTSRRRSAA